MSQLLKKNKNKIREDHALRQSNDQTLDPELYTPLDVGLTMKSMTMVHKIR